MLQESLGSYFNPRSLAGATHQEGNCSAPKAISIHAPSRERLLSAVIQPVSSSFQSTLPRGSDDSVPFTKADNDVISIHAPSRERLFQRKSRLYIIMKISIHAPSRERPDEIIPLAIPPRFQSTLPRGSDRTADTSFFIVNQFQSTLPRGSDRCKRASGLITPKFQSTLPRGSDL